MFQIKNEGKADFYIPKEEKVSKKLPVFYNPVMKFNRDISIAVLNALNRENLQIALPLAGTGIRGIRFFLELNKKIIKTIYLNDYDSTAVNIIKKNLKKNGIEKDFELSQKDANEFLLGSKGFDYIDIDPFGTPNPFLDCAMKRLSRKAILAVTATDTAPLCGTYPKTCVRKYWAKPIHNHLMHEYGLRILIRKIQLVGAQYDRALTPIMSYSKDHYFRIFFDATKGKKMVDEVVKQHAEIDGYGPLWVGLLQKSSIVKKVASLYESNFVKKIVEESETDIVGFTNIHKFCKDNSLKVPKTEIIKEEILKKGYSFFRTHFDLIGFKSNIPEKELKKIIKKLV